MPDVSCFCIPHHLAQSPPHSLSCISVFLYLGNPYSCVSQSVNTLNSCFCPVNSTSPQCIFIGAVFAFSGPKIQFLCNFCTFLRSSFPGCPDSKLQNNFQVRAGKMPSKILYYSKNILLRRVEFGIWLSNTTEKFEISLGFAS